MTINNQTHEDDSQRQVLDIKRCSLCGNDHRVWYYAYTDPAQVPEISGKKPDGYVICPTTRDLLYINFDEELEPAAR